MFSPVPFHAAVEIGLHLEKLPGVLVVGMEDIVKVGVAREDDLHVEGDGLGLQTRRADETILLQHVLDADLPILERPFQCLVRKGVPQELQGVDDKIAPFALCNEPAFIIVKSVVAMPY